MNWFQAIIEHFYGAIFILDDKFRLNFANEEFCKLAGVSAENLIVSDNGVGLPPNMDIRRAESMGLHLVMFLVEDQLRGRLQTLPTFHMIFNEDRK